MPAMESLIEQLSDSVASARTLEDLTRPMLEMLGAVTGLESTTSPPSTSTRDSSTSSSRAMCGS